MIGGTVWADWYPHAIESFAHVRGLGVEMEARDISLDQNLPTQKNMRQDTAGGGLIFNWHLTKRFHPYFKGLLEDGSVDFYPTAGILPRHASAGRFGRRFEYRFLGPFKVRADYEYQYWIGPLWGIRSTPRASRSASHTIFRIRRGAEGPCAPGGAAFQMNNALESLRRTGRFVDRGSARRRWYSGDWL